MRVADEKLIRVSLNELAKKPCVTKPYSQFSIFFLFHRGVL